MKYIVTPLEGSNEPVSFADLIFGNCFLETYHGCYKAQLSPIPSDTQLELLPRTPTGANEYCNIDVHNSNYSIGTNLVANNIWIMYFTGYKMQDGLGIGCVLINPHTKYILSCSLEFECTNNIIKYEALRGLG